MSTYTGTADGSDRAKAIVAVFAVHAALAAAILTGLNVKVVSQAVDLESTVVVKACVFSGRLSSVT